MCKIKNALKLGELKTYKNQDQAVVRFCPLSLDDKEGVTLTKCMGILE